MTPQSRLGIVIGLLLILACGLVITELQRGDEPPVDLHTPEPIAQPGHARSASPPVLPVEPRAAPRPRRVAERPAPAPQPAPQPRQTSDERSVEAARLMLAATRSGHNTVPASRPDFAEMDAAELREHFNVPAEPTPVRQRYSQYVVQPGDNLTIIARRHLGSANGVDTLFELNRDVMDNRDHLVVGMTLRIPISERE